MSKLSKEQEELKKAYDLFYRLKAFVRTFKSFDFKIFNKNFESMIEKSESDIPSYRTFVILLKAKIMMLSKTINSNNVEMYFALLEAEVKSTLEILTYKLKKYDMEEYIK